MVRCHLSVPPRLGLHSAAVRNESASRRTRPDGPSAQLFLEDLEVGLSRELGSFSLSEAEIVEFALRFDPQPFHTDARLAKDSIFGGLVASGVHTIAAFSRLMFDGFVSDVAVTAGRGVRELQLRSPVRPDEEIHARVEVVGIREAPRRPDSGIVTIAAQARKSDGTVVLTLTSEVLVSRRPSSA